MKNLFLILGMVFSMTSQANTIESVFKSNSDIPSELQEKILNYIDQKCEKMVSSYGLNEISTTTKNVKIDQGMIDVYYTTTFTSRYYFTLEHPLIYIINIESVKYAIQNGDNLEVIKSNCEL